MAIEMLLDNKNGNVWDISQIVTDISWKTTRIGKAGSLEFTLIKGGLNQDSAFQFNNGDIVRFKKDGQKGFYGYIFSIDEGKDEDIKITCYDQIRYLMASDTYIFKNVTAGDIIKRIASDFKLKVGQIDDTGYYIPTMLEDAKKLLDIICKGIDLTLINANKNFFLFDDFGELSLRNSEDMLLDFIIGDSSLMTDYKSTRSIDSETYNKVKIYQDNEKTGKRDIYFAQDSANIAKWGVLQLYQSADSNMNAAQINELLNTLISIKNREAKTLKIEAIGDMRVRAGCYVPIIIKAKNINQPFIIEECNHKLDGADHSMSLELKVV